MHKKIRPREIIRQRNRRLTLMTFALLLLALIVGLTWVLEHRDWVGTDDAFVAGHLIAVKAQSDGIVVEVMAENTQPVKKGDTLVRLDGKQTLIALELAKAELAEAVRNIASLKTKLDTLEQRLIAREAALNSVRHDLIRFRAANEDGAASAQQIQNAEDKIVELEAALREIRAEQQGVEAQLLNTGIAGHPTVEKAKSRLRRAFLDYRRRNIVAPVSGYVAKRKIQIGDTLKTGAPLLVIVPLDEVWVEANLLETQVASIRLGQKAEIRADAYHGERLYHGRVNGITPATGSSFALLPTDNSSGNFIHIAERLQVRIALDTDELREHPLQPGLSTQTRINIADDEAADDTAGVELSHEAYRTDIYDHELDGVEQLIEQVIASNSGAAEK